MTPSLEGLVNDIRSKSKHDEIGMILFITQFVEKQLLLHLSKIENNLKTYNGIKDFVTKNHFNFMIGKFLELTEQRFGKECHKDLTNLAKMRNFLVHDSVYFYFLKSTQENKQLTEKVFKEFISTADKILNILYNSTKDLKSFDDLSDDDFIYKAVYEKLLQDIKDILETNR